MAHIIPMERYERIKSIIDKNLYGQITSAISGNAVTPALTQAQIDSPEFPEGRTMLEYAYHTSKGVNGAKVIKLILEKNPTFSARLLLTPAAGDLIVASDIFSYHTVGEDGYPVGGIQIADLTAEEKGKLILILALRYPSKVYGYGQTGHYTSDASSLVKKLLQVGPPVEAKYINTALYYLRNPVPRKILTMPGYYKMEPERFIDILTDDGHAVNIANANDNQGLLEATATNQANYVTKKGAFAAKEAAKAARAAARAARLESWRTNIGAHIKDVLKDNIFEVELIAYLISPEAAAVGPSGKSKLNEKVYTVIGIDVPVTILEYAILMNKNTIVDALLTLPDLLTKIDKDTDIMVHAQRLGMLGYILKYGFNKYTESALFTVAGMTLDDLYTLLEDAVRHALPTLVFNIFANRGVNPVNPGGDDAPPDPTKLDIYHVYFETFAFPPENRYVTLYRRAELIGEHYHGFGGQKEANINLIKDIIAGYNGNITAKEQRAIFKRKLINRAVALAAFNKPPEGPFRDGEPATEAAAFATAKEDNTKWPGFSKSDEELKLHPIFLQDFQTPSTPQEPEGTTVRPSLDITFCPLCNLSIGRSMGCLYMSHTCNPENILDIDLYNKYKTTLTDPAGQISYKTFWCTICNRIANDHGHYKIANIFGPKPDANEQQTGFEVFQNDCGHLGGGGLLEKIGRFDALREECKKLLSEGAAGTISKKEARLRIGKAFWNAPIAPYVARATALKAAAKWNNDPFPPTTIREVEVEPVFNEIVPYNDENGTLLPEVLFVPTEATANTLDTANPVIRYRHRKPNGEIELHEGMYFGANGLFNSLLLHSSFGEANFGQCPLCPTVLHPEEIYYILNEISESEHITTQQLFDFNDIYIKYKHAYQMKYYINKEETALKQATAMIAAAYADAFENNANAEGGGNNKNNKNNKNNNKRNSQANTFPEMEDGVCSLFEKTKGGRRPRTIKRIKLRQRTTRSRPMYVVKKQSRRQRRSSTKKKARR